MGNAAEPDTRHFIHKDIYTFIKFVDAASLVDTVDEERKKSQLFDKPQNHTVAKGDTISLDNCIAVVDNVFKIDSTNANYQD